MEVDQMLGCRGSFGKCLEVKRQGRLSGVGWEGKGRRWGNGRKGREGGLGNYRA